jgi:ABC-type thiamine transport system ATPase subunit
MAGQGRKGPKFGDMWSSSCKRIPTPVLPLFQAKNVFYDTTVEEAILGLSPCLSMMREMLCYKEKPVCARLVTVFCFNSLDLYARSTPTLV